VAVGANHIVTSTDGGQAWRDHVIVEAGINLLGVTCSAASLCLATGTQSQANQATSQARIYRSVNEGATWTLSTVPPQVGGIGSVACPTPTTCIGVGSALLVSANDGSTWTVTGATGGFQDLTSIACSSVSTCIAVGPNPEGQDNHALGADAVLTTNGGLSFTAVTFPAYSASLFEVSCSSVSTCIASGAEGTGQSAAAFVASSDGGVTWSTATPPPGISAIAGISCPSAASCVMVGQSTSGPVSISRSGQGLWRAAQPTAPS
jgi:hypothetical protein